MADNKYKILIVDDDENIRSIYVEIFKKEGFEVEEAVDGLEGLDKATKNPPQVVFTGIIMPKLDGFGLKEALAKNVATANIPVVMSSHMGRKEDEEKAKAMGIRDFIVQGMVTPKAAVERIWAILGDQKYYVKVDPTELDAPDLAKEIHLKPGFRCPNCDSEMQLLLDVVDIGGHKFSASFVCPQCDK